MSSFTIWVMYMGMAFGSYVVGTLSNGDTIKPVLYFILGTLWLICAEIRYKNNKN